MFCGDVKFHFTFIDELLRLVAFLQADLINFLDEGISYTVPKSKNEVNNSLFEWCSSRVNMVKSTNFHNQLKSALSHFSIFMETPLAGKLCQLLIVFA